MLKIGVFGAGHLGRIHIKLAKQVPGFELIGFYDVDPIVSEDVSKEMQVQSFADPDALIEACDVVDIVTPTLSHYELAVKAIKNQRHVFIEKPITNTVEEAKELAELAHEAKVKVQIGHVERFNPAFLACKDALDNPMFIESHRLAQFNPRGTDVPVVLDLMIHDIDIVLSVVKSNAKKVSASGVSVVSDTHDICNARIEFDNGAVANLTASRISMRNMRRCRFFQKEAYITVDFLEKKSQRFQIKPVAGEPDPFAMAIDLGEGKGYKEIYFEDYEVKESNAILDELTLFAQCIEEDTVPEVTVDDGYEALHVAHQILEKLKLNASLLE